LPSATPIANWPDGHAGIIPAVGSAIEAQAWLSGSVVVSAQLGAAWKLTGHVPPLAVVQLTVMVWFDGPSASYFGGVQ
jgi:hypothetical protein